MSGGLSAVPTVGGTIPWTWATHEPVREGKPASGISHGSCLSSLSDVNSWLSSQPHLELKLKNRRHTYEEFVVFV